MNVFTLFAEVAINRQEAIADLNAIEAEAKQTGNTLGGKFAGITKGVGLAAIGVAAAAGTALASFAAVGIKSAAAMEQTRTAYAVFTGSAESAEVVLGRIRDLAASTPFAFPELASAGQKLLAFQTPAEKVPEILGRIGDVAAGIGAPIGELADLYGKLQVQGVVTMEDINQMTGRGIPIISELAEQFGVAESQIKGMVSEGGVTFANIEQGFKNMTSEGGTFFGMMAKQSETVAGKWSTVKDAFGEVARKVGEKLLPIISDLLSWFLDNMPQIQAAVEGAFDAIGGAISFITDKVIPPLRDMFGGIATDSGAMGSQLRDIFNSLKEFLTTVFNALVALWTEVLKPAWEAIGPLVKGVFDSIGPAIELALDVITGVLKVFTSFLSGDFSGAFTAMKELIVDIWEGLSEIVGNILGGLIDSIVGILGGLTSKAREKSEAAMQALIDGVTGFFSNVKDAATGIVTTVIDTISGLPGQMLQVGKDIVQGLINGVTQMFGAARDTITNFAGNIGGWFKDTLGISSPSRVFMGYGRNLAEGLGIGLNKNLPRVTSRIDSFVESTARKFQGLQKRLQAIASTSVNFEGMLGGSGKFVTSRNLDILFDKMQEARARIESLREAINAPTRLSAGADAVADAMLRGPLQDWEDELSNLLAMYNQLLAKQDAARQLAEGQMAAALSRNQYVSRSSVSLPSGMEQLPDALGALGSSTNEFSQAVQQDIDARRSFSSRLTRTVETFERSVNRFTLADLRS